MASAVNSLLSSPEPGISASHHRAYTPLDPGREEVRLLELHHGADPDPIVCSTESVFLDDNPTYTALSYVWGDPTQRATLAFNGVTGFPITRNLDDALRQLRRPDRDVIIWADALCINQNDEAEKSSQVKKMGQIYRQAQETCIWLGKEADDSDHAVDVLAKLDIENFDSPANVLDTRDLTALGKLQARPWFSRTWVIQECLLSANPIAQMGKCVFPMDYLVKLDDLNRGWHRGRKTYQTSPWITTQSLRNPFSNIFTYWDDREDIRASRTSMQEWALYLDNFEATDPRDKIFGLMGFATEYEKRVVQVDYTMSVAQVYTLATICFIKQSRELFILAFDRDNRTDKLDLPSWVPDYARTPPTDDPQWFRCGYVPLSVKAGVPMKASGTGVFGFDKIKAPLSLVQGTGEELHLRAVLVGEVVEASANLHRVPHYLGYDSEERARSVRKRADYTLEKVKEWQAKLDQVPVSSQVPTMAKDEVFWRTISLNGTFRGDPWPEECSNQYFDVWTGKDPVPDEYATAHPGLSAEDLAFEYARPYVNPAVTYCTGRSFVVMDNGYMGLAPVKAAVGDCVCVLEGGGVPYVLRPSKDDTRGNVYVFIGEAFVLGVSDGSWISSRTEEDIVQVLLK